MKLEKDSGDEWMRSTLLSRGQVAMMVVAMAMGCRDDTREPAGELYVPRSEAEKEECRGRMARLLQDVRADDPRSIDRAIRSGIEAFGFWATKQALLDSSRAGDETIRRAGIAALARITSAEAAGGAAGGAAEVEEMIRSAASSLDHSCVLLFAFPGDSLKLRIAEELKGRVGRNDIPLLVRALARTEVAHYGGLESELGRDALRDAIADRIAEASR